MAPSRFGRYPIGMNRHAIRTVPRAAAPPLVFVVARAHWPTACRKIGTIIRSTRPTGARWTETLQ